MGKDSDKQHFTHNTYFFFSLWIYSFAMKNHESYFFVLQTHN